MKKKFYSIFALILSIVLSLSLLSGCGGEDDSGDQSDTGDTGDAVTMEIAGDAWEADGTVYHFFEDGVAYVDTGFVLSYSWDGSYGEITDGEFTVAIGCDEDGFYMEGEDGELYELTYVGEADASLLGEGDDSSDDTFSDTIDLVGTAWEVADGEFQFHFFTNGDAATNDGGLLSYTWDGSYGEISGGGSSLEMIYDEDGFFIEGNDGIYHEFVDIGEADINLLVENGYYDDDDDDDGGWGLAGTYDNDNEEMSICFYSDGTCTVTTLYEAFEGYYSKDANDNLYIELENGQTTSGWYDASDDTFSLEDMSGWFHYTGSAGYTP